MYLAASLKNRMKAEKQERYDKAYLKMALEWAKLSHCKRKQVGALIVKNRMIISTFAFLDNDKPRSYNNEENFMIFSGDHHELYLAAYKMFLDKPLLGQGHKMYKENCKNYKNRSASSCSTHPHNILLQIGVENGVIGLLFLSAIYLYLIKLFFYNLKKPKKYEKNKSFFFQICLLSIITANIFPLVPSGNFFNNWLSILYYLPIGLYLSTTISKDNRYE